MQLKRPFFKQTIALMIAFFIITTPTLSNAEESTQKGLQRCGLINNSSARLACYDQLGGRKGLAVAKSIEPMALQQDEVSSSLLAKQNTRRAEPVSATLKVIKCVKRGGNNKYMFYLEDGQVWKQISSKRLNFKNCNFDVSILKDFFGYKMQLQDSKKKFSVSRVR